MPQNVSALVQAKLQQGMGLFRAGRLADAERFFAEARQLEPRNFDAHYLSGVILLQTGRILEAAELLRRAVELNPRAGFAHFDLGCALSVLGRHEQALMSYENAIALKPDHADAHVNRGNALSELNRNDEALVSHDRAIALKPDHADAYCSRGVVLNALARHAEALASHEKALALRPDHASAHNNRAVVLYELKRYAEALAGAERAIVLSPAYAEAHLNRGNALKELSRHEEALASYDKALALNPKDSVHHNRSLLLLLLGRFEEGLREYEFRKRGLIQQRFLAFPERLWLGEQSIAGKTLLIYQDFLIGDVLQFCRYAKLAEAKGARVILLVQSSLHRLLQQLSPTLELISEDAPLPQFDYHCPLMSLPLAFKTTVDTIFAPVPYLHAEEERVLKWRKKLGSAGFKIGICWEGSKLAYAASLERSCDLPEFFAIAKIPNVRLISLQKTGGFEQRFDLPAGMQMETLGDEFDSGPDAFLDCAAVMESLDLVISVDTSIAHLAGALARPTWVALKYIPDWRWLLNRNDSPWYPTMRLFRQTGAGDWTSAFVQMEKELIPMAEEKTKTV